MSNCSRCGAFVEEELAFCPRCGQETRPPAPRPTPTIAYPPPPGPQPASAYPPPPPATDPWFNHFLRYVGVSLLVAVATQLLVGLFWMAHIFNRTGYRKRDVLWLFVPIAGAVVQSRAIWRYTSRDVYWTPRHDRPSDLLRGWQRPWAIAGGWVLGSLLLVGVIVAVASFEFGWSAQQREELIQRYEDAGYSRPEAECIADEYIDEIPDADEDLYSADDRRDAEDDAIDLCETFTS